MTLYRSIACSILLTVTIAETVPDAKQAFEKYVKERDFMKGIYMFFSWSKWVAPMCSIKKEYFPKDLELHHKYPADVLLPRFFFDVKKARYAIVNLAVASIHKKAARILVRSSRIQTRRICASKPSLRIMITS